MNSINLVTKVMNKGNLKEKLFEVFSVMDADFTGENGEEYLWGEAKEKGFKSNFDYSLAKAKEKYSSIKDVINYVIARAVDGWNGYYEDTEYSVEEVGNEYVVMIAVVSKN